MSAHRREDRGNHWHYRRVVTMPDGTKQRIGGKAPLNTKRSAEEAERAHVERTLNPPAQPAPPPAAAPTFTEWFEGRFWEEAVVAENHAPRTRELRRTLFKTHLRDSIGSLPLDQFDIGVIQRLKAELAQKPGRGKATLSPATQHAVLTVVGLALRYAEDAGVIGHAPKVKTPKVQAPEIEIWGFDEHLALLGAAERQGYPWLLAVLLAGDAGLRIGEIRGLRVSDVDFAGNVLSVRRQRDKTGTLRETTKGKKPRTVPLSSTLVAALSSVTATGDEWVVTLDPKQLNCGSRPLCVQAGLPPSGWHRLRHTYGTNCARFRAGPWELQRWLGHASVTTTERYVHLADAHKRELPGRVAMALADGPIAAVGALSAPALPSEVVSIRRATSVPPALRRMPRSIDKGSVCGTLEPSRD